MTTKYKKFVTLPIIIGIILFIIIEIFKEFKNKPSFHQKLSVAAMDTNDLMPYMINASLRADSVAFSENTNIYTYTIMNKNIEELNLGSLKKTHKDSFKKHYCSSNSYQKNLGSIKWETFSCLMIKVEIN